MILTSTIIVGLIGTSLLVIGIHEYEKLIISGQAVSFFQVIKISTYYEISISFIFFAFLLSVSIFSGEFIWDFEELAGAILISMIPGIITLLGSVYQIYTTIKYRGLLITKNAGKK